MNEIVIVFKDKTREALTLQGKQVGCKVVEGITYQCFANAEGVDQTVYIPIAEVQSVTITIV